MPHVSPALELMSEAAATQERPELNGGKEMLEADKGRFS
jgi:hypothetical protein